MPESELEPGSHLPQPVKRQPEDDYVDELDPEVEAAIRQAYWRDSAAAQRLREAAKRDRMLREDLKHPQPCGAWIDATIRRGEVVGVETEPLEQTESISRQEKKRA